MLPSSSLSIFMFTDNAHSMLSQRKAWWHLHKLEETVHDASHQCEAIDMTVVMLGQSAHTVMQCNRMVMKVC